MVKTSVVAIKGSVTGATFSTLTLPCSGAGSVWMWAQIDSAATASTLTMNFSMDGTVWTAASLGVTQTGTISGVDLTLGDVRVAAPASGAAQGIPWNFVRVSITPTTGTIVTQVVLIAFFPQGLASFTPIGTLGLSST